MQITEDITSYCYNSRNDSHADQYYWHIPNNRTWVKQAANLYENLSKMPSRSRKAGLQDTKKLI